MQQEDLFSELLPASPVDRELLGKYILEVSGYKDIIDEMNDNVKDVVATVTSKDGKLRFPAKEFNLRVKAFREASKMKDQAQAIHCALDDISLLKLS